MTIFPFSFRAALSCFQSVFCEWRCALCGTPSPGPRKKIPLCQTCATRFRPIEKDRYCPGCGELLPKKDERRFFCQKCLVSPPLWQEIHVFGRYEAELQYLLAELKFHGKLWIAPLLGALLADSMPESFCATPFLLIPLPLSPQRLKERGYNQTYELARPVVAKFSFEMDEGALVRCRHTSPQSGLSEAGRALNIRGAFQAEPKKVEGRHILLVDDIMTTGHTLREAARTLLTAGAKGISLLVVARTPKHFSQICS